MSKKLIVCIIVLSLIIYAYAKYTSKAVRGRPTMYTGQKRIVVNLGGGLGNRLRSLTSAMVLAHALSLPLFVVWRKVGGELPKGMKMSDVFDVSKMKINGMSIQELKESPPENATLHTDDQCDSVKLPCYQKVVSTVSYPTNAREIVGFGSLSSSGSGNMYYHKLFKDKKMSEETFHELRNMCIRSIAYNTNVLKYKKMIQAQWGDTKYIGVHIRRGDLCDLIHGSDGCANLDHYRNEMKIASNSQTKNFPLSKNLAQAIPTFFLASDDKIAIKSAKQWAIEEGWKVYFDPMVAPRDTIQGQQAAMAEILVLSESDYIIGTLSSTFTSEAAFMHNVPYVQIGIDGVM